MRLQRVRIWVSEPWEFGTECGVGPFEAVVEAEKDGRLFLRLVTELSFNQHEFPAAIATPRHEAETTSGVKQAVNLMFIEDGTAPLSEGNELPRSGTLPAIG